METITNARARDMTIGQLSRVTGVKVETIRYYERIKLQNAPPRTSGGRRHYGDGDVRHLRFIRRARELGFSIESIRALLALADRDRAPCGDVRDVAAAHLTDIRARLADLTKLEAILADTVAQCDANCSAEPAPLCPVLEVLQS